MPLVFPSEIEADRINIDLTRAELPADGLELLQARGRAGARRG